MSFCSCYTYILLCCVLHTFDIKLRPRPFIHCLHVAAVKQNFISQLSPVSNTLIIMIYLLLLLASPKPSLADTFGPSLRRYPIRLNVILTTNRLRQTWTGPCTDSFQNKSVQFNLVRKLVISFMAFLTISNWDDSCSSYLTTNPQ